MDDLDAGYRSATSAAGFLERYRQTEAELQAYVETLPLWVNLWRGWMFFIFTAAVAFVVRKREARWLAVTLVVSLFAYNLVAMGSGVGRFPSIAFVLLWSPLPIFLARRRPHLAARRTFDRVHARWLDAALATLVISLAFDVYNVAYSSVTGVPRGGVGSDPRECSEMPETSNLHGIVIADVKGFIRHWSPGAMDSPDKTPISALGTMRPRAPRGRRAQPGLSDRRGASPAGPPHWRAGRVRARGGG